VDVTKHCIGFQFCSSFSFFFFFLFFPFFIFLYYFIVFQFIFSPFTMGCSLTFALDHLKVFWYMFFFLVFFPLFHFLCYFIVFQFYFPLSTGCSLTLDNLKGFRYTSLCHCKIEGLSHRTPYTNTQKPTSSSSSSSNAFADNMNYLPWSIHPSIHQ
jgi:hypothetical protein